MISDARFWVFAAWTAMVVAAAAAVRLASLRRARSSRPAAPAGDGVPGAAAAPPRAVLLSLAAAGGSLLSAGGWGDAVVRLGFPDLDLGGPSGLVLRAALGWGVLSYLTFAAGMTGRLTRGWTAALHAPGIAVAGVSAARWAAAPGTGEIPVDGPAGVVAAASCAAIAGIALLSCFAPPRGWDALAYHLELPRRYAAGGSIRHVPSMAHSPWPQAAHMLYVPGFLIRATHHAQLLSWMMGLGLAVMVADAARIHLGWDAAWIACLALFMVGEFVFQMADASVDVGLALFTGCSILVLARWAAAPEASLLVLAAILAGLAAAAKMSALLWGGLGSASAMAAALAHGSSLLSSAGSALLFGGVAIAVASPWYIRSAALTGNPVYHFATRVFRTSYWPSSSEQAHRDVARAGKWGGVRRGEILAYALAAGLKDPTGWGAGIVALAPMALMWPAPAAVTWAGLLSAALAGVTLLCTSQLRLLMGCAAGLALLAGHAFHGFSSSLPDGAWQPRALAAALGIAGVGGALHLSRHKVAAALRPRLAPAFLQRFLPYYEDYAWINRHLPREARLLIWTTRGWLLEREYVWLPPWQQGVFDFSRIHEGSQFLREMKSQGITHVYFTDVEIKRPLFGYLYTLHEQMVRDGLLVEQRSFAGGSRVLYRLA